MGSLNVKRGNVQVDYGSFILYNGNTKWKTSFDLDSDYKISYISPDGSAEYTCAKFSASSTESAIEGGGTGSFYIRAKDGASLGFQTNSITRGGFTAGGNLFLGSATDTLNRTLGVTGTAEVTTGLSMGFDGYLPIDATLHIKSANGGYSRCTQLQNGVSGYVLNIMRGPSTWYSWGVDASNRWNITPNSAVFGTNGFMMDSSGQMGLGGVPVSGYRLYIYGATSAQKFDQNGATSILVDNQSNGAAAQVSISASALGGACYLGCVGTGWSIAAGSAYAVLNGGSGYISSTTNKLAIIAQHASGVINVLSGGALNTNIRARWSAAGNLALGYGDLTDATEKLQLKNGNFKLDGTAGTHGIIFPDTSKQTTALGSYTTSFTDASLTAGILTVTHNLGSKYCVVQVYNDLDVVITPDSITGTSTTVTTIDLTSFGALTGTWNVRIVK